jgi:hypothetical protein
MSVDEANALFLRGDYLAAREAFTALAADPSLSDEQRQLVASRLNALKPDRAAIAFGLITATVVIVVYVLSRFVL